MSGHSETYIVRGRRNLTADGLRSSGARLLPAGTVVFSSRAPIGYCAVAANALSTSQGCKNIVLNSGNVPEYLMHYLRYSKTYAEGFASGTTFLELSAAKVRTLAVPVPPRDQQEAISVGLQHLLGRIRSIRALLAPIPDMAAVQVDRILADAYEGRLTEGWRRATVVSAPSFSRVADLLATPIQNGLSVKGRDKPPGVRALRLSALRSRRVDLEDVRFLPIDEARAKRFLLKDGDILVSRGNGTKALVGRAALTDGLDQPTIYPDTAFRLRANMALALPEWLSHILNAPQIRRIVETSARTTAGIWKIRQSDITDLNIPVPGLAEQQEVINQVGRALAQIDGIYWSVANAEEMLNILESTVHSLAFRGNFTKYAIGKLLDVTLDELRLQAAETDIHPPPITPVESYRGPAKMSRALKSRIDPEVQNKPYLASLLGDQTKGTLPAKALFEISALSIVDFYKQLTWEIDSGHLKESKDGFQDGR